MLIGKLRRLRIVFRIWRNGGKASEGEAEKQCWYRIENCIQANMSFRYFRKTDIPNQYHNFYRERNFIIYHLFFKEFSPYHGRTYKMQQRLMLVFPCTVKFSALFILFLIIKKIKMFKIPDENQITGIRYYQYPHSNMQQWHLDIIGTRKISNQRKRRRGENV
jgi:hypothetical protein